MQEQPKPKKPRKRAKPQHIVLFVIAIVLLLASILAFLAGAIGLTYLLAKDMDRLEGAEPLFPGAEGFVIMSYVILWVLGIFVMLVLLAVCWIIGLVLAVILTFFMKQKPLWLRKLQNGCFFKTGWRISPCPAHKRTKINHGTRK